MSRTFVKGFVQIPKNPEENEEFYKQRISYLLYTLLASYKAVSREVWHYSDDWFSHTIRAFGYEEPSENTTEKEILDDEPKRDAFVEHHATKGWNKITSTEAFMSDMEVHHGSYATDSDQIHWIRVENNERRNIDVYLIKYCDYDIVTEDTCQTLNGVLFAEQNRPSIRDKVKRVVQRFSTFLTERKVPHYASIELPNSTEILKRNEQTGNLEWIITKIKPTNRR